MSAPQRLKEFLYLCRRLEKAPGFDHYLKVNHFLNAKLDDTKKILTVQLQPPPNPPSLSYCLAVLDDITTWGCVLADPRRNRAGKSISFVMHRTGALPTTATPLTAVSHVAKVGNNIGFINAQIVSSDTNQVLCEGHHIKYMPMGKVADTALSHWNLSQWYARTLLPTPSTPPESCGDAWNTYEYHNGAATVERHSLHASLGGPVHGGCQAMLMEHTANRFTQLEEKCLESIDVQYLSPPISKQLRIRIVDSKDLADQDRMLVKVQIVPRDDDNKVYSEGLLQYKTS